MIDRADDYLSSGSGRPRPRLTNRYIRRLATRPSKESQSPSKAKPDGAVEWEADPTVIAVRDHILAKQRQRSDTLLAALKAAAPEAPPPERQRPPAMSHAKWRLLKQQARIRQMIAPCPSDGEPLTVTFQRQKVGSRQAWHTTATCAICGESFESMIWINHRGQLTVLDHDTPSPDVKRGAP